jgi:hypothetical protein
MVRNGASECAKLRFAMMMDVGQTSKANVANEVSRSALSRVAGISGPSQEDVKVTDWYYGQGESKREGRRRVVAAMALMAAQAKGLLETFRCPTVSDPARRRRRRKECGDLLSLEKEMR